MRKENWLDSIYHGFDGCIDAARQMHSVNKEDTIEIKIAVVGFVQNAKIDDWSIDEYEFIKESLDQCTEAYNQRGRLFYALARGFIMGLLHAQKITDVEYHLRLFHVDGFIFIKGGEFLKED